MFLFYSPEPFNCRFFDWISLPDPVGAACNRNGSAKKEVKRGVKCVRRFWLPNLHEVPSGLRFWRFLLCIFLVRIRIIGFTRLCAS